jgi:hypothetical protein
MEDKNTKIEDGSQNKVVETLAPNASNEEVKIEVLEEEWDETNSPIKPKKSFSKLIAKLIFGLVAILIFVLLLVAIFHNTIISSMVTKAGSLVVGTPVALGKFDLSLSGKVEIADFTIGNPEGYQNPTAFQLKRIFVDVNLASVLTDEIVVNKVEIDGVSVDFEQKLTTNNLNEIKANVEKNIASLQSKVTGGKTSQEAENVAASTEASQSETKENKASKSLLIKQLLVKNTSLTLSNKTLSSTITLPVANLEMTNVGGKGESIPEVVNKVLNAFLKSTQNTISSGAKAIGKIGLEIGNSLFDSGKKTGETLKNTGKQILKNLGF